VLRVRKPRMPFGGPSRTHDARRDRRGVSPRSTAGGQEVPVAFELVERVAGAIGDQGTKNGSHVAADRQADRTSAGDRLEHSV
jgi:hypothetical protein